MLNVPSATFQLDIKAQRYDYTGSLSVYIGRNIKVSSQLNDLRRLQKKQQINLNVSSLRIVV